MKIAKTLFVLSSLFSFHAFAGIGWNITIKNDSSEDLQLDVSEIRCFSLHDFNTYNRVIPAHGQKQFYAEEINSGFCNATFYRDHHLELMGSFSEKAYFPIKFGTDFTNAPLKRPVGSVRIARKELLVDNASYSMKHYHNKDMWHEIYSDAYIHATYSSAYLGISISDTPDETHLVLQYANDKKSREEVKSYVEDLVQ